MPDTCIHRADGLCEQCQAEYAEDPSAWLEYGQHEAGERNWQQRLEEMGEDAALVTGLSVRED